jgi:diadenosine tetraphosphate (Ap4A) HIT family hydrolase
MECEYFDQLKKYESCDLVAETEYWLIILSPDQKNLGTIVITLKRKEKSLSGLTNSEWLDFRQLVQNLELALKKAFPVTMFNWGCLLNSAYKENPPCPQVHWHMIPRYKNTHYLNGIKFKDPCFGKSTMYAGDEPLKIDGATRKKIIEKIRYYLNI